MKNNFLILKCSLIVLIFLISKISTISAKELNFKATEILTYDEEDKIVGLNNAEAKIDGEIEIFADKFTYFKKKIY